MESKDEIVKTIPRTFYERDTVKVARDLLGKKLIRTIGKQTISGIITETEAYRYSDDPASHAYRGLTSRNRAMFEQVGKAYVYFTYGMYFCFNVVARNHNFAAGAVLIRSLNPEKGIGIMKKNRIPKESEKKACERYLKTEISLIKPKIICVMGNTAYHSLLGGSNIMKNHGKIVKKNGNLYFVTIHPAATIYNQSLLQTLKKDMKTLVKTLNGIK